MSGLTPVLLFGAPDRTGKPVPRLAGSSRVHSCNQSHKQSCWNPYNQRASAMSLYDAYIEQPTPATPEASILTAPKFPLIRWRGRENKLGVRLMRKLLFCAIFTVLMVASSSL